MAYQPETATYDAGVFQLETNTPVLGGVGGAANAPLLNLADRTAYLKQHVDAIESSLASNYAQLNSPAFTGTPTVPDLTLGDRSTKIANSDFVQDTVNGVSTVNVAGGANVVLTAAQAGTGTLVLVGAITANIAVIVPNTARKWEVSNQTTGAFTLTVKTAAGSGVAVGQGANTMLWCDATNVLDAKTDFPNANLTGSPVAPTALAGDRSTLLATMAAVSSALNGLSTINVAGNADVVLAQAQWGLGILVFSGALTGNINVIVPAQPDQWTVKNLTTGAFTLTLKLAASAGVVCPQGKSIIAYSDGADVFRISAINDQTVTTQATNAAAGQTVFPVTGGYTPGNLQVFKSGTFQPPSAYTATDGANVVLNVGTLSTDLIEVVTFASFQVGSTYSKSQIDSALRTAQARAYFMGQFL